MARESVNFDDKLDLPALVWLSEQPNIARYFTDEKLTDIGRTCKAAYEMDRRSLAEWLNDLEEIREFAKTSHETKTYPWPGASNVKYPLILSSAMQFNARAYPAIVNMGTPVLGKTIGDDPEGIKQAKADRVSKHMSYQLTEEMTEWDEDMDRLLLTLPLDGVCFKKVYYNPVLKRNCSELVMADDLIVNMDTMSLETCPRISHRCAFYPYEIMERVNMEIFLEIDYDIEDGEKSQDPIGFIEQHCWIDTDGDGYPEPYIVTLTEDEGKVVRVRANFRASGIQTDPKGNVVRIERLDYFVKYECFPDPNGGFYGKGFGALLKPLNDSVDSILNQLIDAGHLANTGGGFVAKSFRLESGSIKFSPGKWEKVDTAGFPMRDAIMPMPFDGPSGVLFQLLGLLIEAAKELGSTQDVMTGGSPGANTPATTTLAIIEQGMKVYTAIFKRIYRAMKKELAMLFELNALFVDDGVYKVVLDNKQAIAQKDYDLESLDIMPAADPASATDIQKAAKAQLLMSFYGTPTANSVAIQNDVLLYGGISDPQKYIAPPPQGPSPEEIEAMVEAKFRERELDIEEMRALSDAYKNVASAAKNYTDAMREGGTPQTALVELEAAMTVMEQLQNEQSVQDQGGIPAVAGEQPMDAGMGRRDGGDV